MSKTLNEWRDTCGEWATKKGWNDANKMPTVGDDIALMHSELSEALEQHRAGHSPAYIWYNAERSVRLEDGTVIPKPEGVGIEMIDCIYRICHFAAKHQIDLDAYMNLKHAYNEGRAVRHGGKTI